MKYVDGYVIPIKKKNLKEYIKLARICRKAWLKAGALDYTECVGDDIDIKCGIPFRKFARLKKGEAVIFAYVVFKSKIHRDRVNNKVMKDLEGVCDENNVPFDVKRMTWGGFKAVVGR